jgi:hypothetical protein
MMDDSTSRRIAHMKAGLRVIHHIRCSGSALTPHKLHWKELGFQ